MTLKKLEQDILGCARCTRLREHCLEVGRLKRKAYTDQTYCTLPVTGFGDPRAQVWVVGLAPAAHGANRTGRVFTGDRSGDWLYRALYRAGFANQPESTRIDDGLKLTGAYVSCVVRCAPPDNKPSPEETQNCLSYLRRERDALAQARVVIVLGGFALRWIWPELASNARLPKFVHGLELTAGHYTVLTSYHPSQQNTFTKRLTEPMLDDVFARARALTMPNR